jgi:hypothetical protein
MRYVCHIYEDGSIYAYETTDDGWKVLGVFEGEMPEPIKRISAFAELSADNTAEGRNRLKKALTLLQEVVRKKGL